MGWPQSAFSSGSSFFLSLELDGMGYQRPAARFMLKAMS